MRAAIGPADRYDLVIFISANAVRFGADILGERRDVPVAAVGQATAAALNAAGYRVSLLPSEGADSESLLAMPQLADMHGKRVLIVRGSGGRELLQAEMAGRAARRCNMRRCIPASPPIRPPNCRRKSSSCGDRAASPPTLRPAWSCSRRSSASSRSRCRELMDSTMLVTGSRRVADAAARLGLGSPIDDCRFAGGHRARRRAGPLAGTGENMTRFGRALAHLALLLPAAFSAAAYAQAVTDPAVAPPARPRIGLVLAGGGAKGGAHIGALKVLEELRVPIDCIAGTSIGALVGAGYATGQPAAEIEKFVTGIDWAAVIGGVGRRTLEPIEQKRLAIDAGSKVQMGLIDGKLVTPSGLADASSIDDLLRSYVARARTVSDFNKLPIPFRAVATDMMTGDMVVLDHGDIATAMRASMAIPGAFSPVVLDPYILSDGGMVRNIPIDVARNTCADIVIVVNLVEPAPTREKLVQAQQLLSRSMDVMFEVNEKAQLATLTERDILINVPMGDITTGDFDRMPETIPLGEVAARKVADRLAALALPAPEYTAWRSGVTTTEVIEAKVVDVRVEGLDYVNPEYLRTLTDVEAGDTVAVGDISDDARHMAALDELDTVAYRLEGDPAASTLVWLPKEVSLGQSVLRPALGLFADGAGDFKFLMGVQHVRHWVNPLGAQWRNQLQIGDESFLTTSFYQPLDVAQRTFVEPGLFLERLVEDLYNDGERIATYQFIDVGGRIDFGWNTSRYTQLRFGYLFDQRKTRIDTGLEVFPQIDADDAGLAFSARYDSRDTATFATKGFAAAVRYEHIDESLGSDRNWDRLEVAARKAISIGKYLTWLTLAGGSDLGTELPPDRLFSLGGPQVMPAFQHDELRVSDYWIAESSFLRQLKVLSPIKNQAIYGGLGFQAVGLRNRIDVEGDRRGSDLRRLPVPGGPDAARHLHARRRWHRQPVERLALRRQVDLDRHDPRRRPVPLAGESGRRPVEGVEEDPRGVRALARQRRAHGIDHGRRAGRVDVETGEAGDASQDRLVDEFRPSRPCSESARASPRDRAATRPRTGLPACVRPSTGRLRGAIPDSITSRRIALSGE